MNKKIVLIVGLLFASSIPVKAAGEIISVVVGMMCGTGYERVVTRAPVWASIPAVAAIAVLQAMWFRSARGSYRKAMPQAFEKIALAQRSADLRNNLLLTYATALVTGLVVYPIDKYLTKKANEYAAAHGTNAGSGIGVI